MYIHTYHRWYVVENKEDCVGNEVAAEEEGADVGKRNRGQTGEYLQRQKIQKRRGRCTAHIVCNVYTMCITDNAKIVTYIFWNINKSVASFCGYRYNYIFRRGY